MRAVIVVVASLVVVVGVVVAQYDESFARNKALALSAGAYSNHPENCLQNRFVNAKLIGKYDIKCDGFNGDDCFGFTALAPNDNAIVVGFRGSQGFLQLVSEGVESIFGKKTPSPIGGSVSLYFYNAFLGIWNAGMKDDFLSLKNANPTFKIWVTGHSLGGAMATICASNIVKYGYTTADNIMLYTFGQPRTGDKTYAAAHDAMMPNSYRVTHNRDLVPHLPPEKFEDYYHHKNEIWYDNDMSIGSSHVECDSDESHKCSDGDLITLSIKDHLHYFGVDVSGYGELGCTP